MESYLYTILHQQFLYNTDSSFCTILHHSTLYLASENQ